MIQMVVGQIKCFPHLSYGEGGREGYIQETVQCPLQDLFAALVSRIFLILRCKIRVSKIDINGRGDPLR
jgi:hypothetical protein